MASSATGDGYSPLATPTRSSLRQPGSRAFTGTTNSVRFFGITHDHSEDDDHTSGVGPTQGRSSIAIKQAIFQKYFNEFTTYPLLLVNASQKSTRGNSRANSRGTKSIRSGIITPSIQNVDYTKAGAAWTQLASTHVPTDFEPSGPRWAISRRHRAPHGKGTDNEYGTGPLHAATRAVTTDGSLFSHLKAFEALLAKPWTSKGVQQAETHGFFWRLVPHLGMERIQGPVALLLARCARVRPALLVPLIQRVSPTLPVLISSPRQDVRQAGLCLLGLLWRAATDGPAQLPSTILETPRLMEALAARTDAGDFDALWAVRELATDARGVSALESCGVLRAVCRALKRLVDSATAAVAIAHEEGAEAEVAAEQVRHRQVLQLSKTGLGGPAPPAGAGDKNVGANKKKDKGSERAGITEGGDPVEQAARGVLVAECLSACSSVHHAVLVMCDSQKIPSKWANPERNRVPERLTSLMLLIGAELEKEEGEEERESELEPAAGQIASKAASVTSAAREVSKSADGPPLESASMMSGREASGPTPSGAPARGEEDAYSDGLEEGEASGGNTGRRRAVSGSGKGSSISGGGGGGGGSKSGASTGGERGLKAQDGVADDNQRTARQISGFVQADPRVGTVRKAQRKLQDALLRSLYGIASSGHCSKPQQGVQEALLGGGDAVVERLVAVLRGGHQRQQTPRPISTAVDNSVPDSRDCLTLDACSAAAYLLWLVVSGDFSPSEASELNVLRARMAREAPGTKEGQQVAAAGGTAGGDGVSRYDASGFGVVQAVAELLLIHLPEWREPHLGDCVTEVGTTPPPPPLSKVAAGTTASTILHGSGGGRSGGGGSVVTGTGTGTGAGSVSGSPGGRVVSQPDNGVDGIGDGGSNNTSASRRQAAFTKGAGSNTELVGGMATPAPRALPSTSEAPTDPRVAPVSGSVDATPTTQPRLAPLRIASTTGLLLTPRDNRVGSASAASPIERYGRGDSSDDDLAGTGKATGSGGGGGGGGGHEGKINQLDSSATGDPTQDLDLDLSNVIDSSVELTGKEHVMRMIAATGAALLSQGELGSGEGRAGSVALLEQGKPDGTEHMTTFPANSGAASATSTGTAVEPEDPAAAASGLRRQTSQRFMEHVASSSEASDMFAASGCTPLGAPAESTVQASGGGGSSSGGAIARARLTALEASRPAALIVPPSRKVLKTAPAPPPLLPSVATWLNAVRFVRQDPAGAPLQTAAAAATRIQELQTCCMGLLAAIALSGGGCRAICAQSDLLPYVASLLELPDVHDDSAQDLETAALGTSGRELRFQLLALLTNLSMHQEGAAAIAAATSSVTSKLLSEGLYDTAERAIQLMSSSINSWRLGAQLLESCFTVMTNMHRSHSALRLDSDRNADGGPRDSFRLATEALRAQLPTSVSAVDRTRIRAAAARMLDSAIVAYEGVGRNLTRSRPRRGGRTSAAKATAALAARKAAAGIAAAADEMNVVSELIWLLAGGTAASNSAAASSTTVAKAAERAAVDGASALWQLMASGTVHPEDLVSELEPPLVSVLESSRAAADSERPAALRMAALGLVSCLGRAAAVARRLWTSPLLPAVLKTHSFARRRCAAGGGETWRPVLECVRGVCQALCRVCHSNDRGCVVGPDKRVDRWGYTERMLMELRCKLAYDSNEDAIVLLLQDEDGEEEALAGVRMTRSEDDEE